MKTIELPEKFVKMILTMPESGMGYHKLNIILNSGKVLGDRTVINSSLLILKTDEKLDINEIASFSRI